MNPQDKDLKNILKYYVNSPSQGEIDFIEEHKKFGLKVCDRISHQRSRDGKDELRVETQLSSTNDSSESSGNRTCTLLKADSSASRSSLGNSDHYIKEQRVTHVGKSKSLDEEHINRQHLIHETSVVTVVGNKRGQYDTVYKAVIGHSDNGGHTLHQESFVRDASNVPTSYHSLPERIHNSVSLPSGSKGYSVNRKKSNKGKSWKSLFSGQKKSKKSHVDLSSIDVLARQRVNEKKDGKFEVKATDSPMSLNRELPFKSHKVGERLQPIHKNTKISRILKNFMSVNNSLPRTGHWHAKKVLENNKSGDDSSQSGYHIDKNEMGGDNVTRVVATLSSDNEFQDFTYLTNLNNNNDFVTDRRRNASGADRTSNFHFDMSLSETRTRRQSCPDKPCNCSSKRMDLIVKALNSLISKKMPHSVIEDIADFDQNTFHFKTCQFNMPGTRKDSTDSTRQSRLSLYQSCEHCGNADDQLHPDISSHLLPLITTLEDGDEINFNEDHLKFFLSANCYKQFEEGMGQAIGFECSAQNLAYLHYITRRVVRHIGDPVVEDNEKIRQIMYFAEKFLVDHFGAHIREHGSVGEFLENCRHNEID